jgi:leader peptidase (prepilin peptidase)/N-methyltransferase
MSDLAFLIYLFSFVAFVGLCLGSFATALIYRIPRGIPWVYDPQTAGDKACRSRCTSCGTKLGFLDLVPLFSWLLSGGKCRHCKARISKFYPMIELSTMFLVVLLFGGWSYAPAAFPLYMAIPFLVAALVIDWDHMILPDSINFSLAVLSIFHVFLLSWQGGWDMSIALTHTLAAVLLVGVFGFVAFVIGRIKGRNALGRGDLKFLAPAGLILGLAPLPSYMAVSGVLGLVIAVARRGGFRSGAFPFGPALIISLYLHVFLTGLGFDYKW